ncbi:alpha/beta hydrolase family esterase [Rhodovulum sp. DZ06]|uniref:alpha/beta hydrolase family esterase n=1 Tax=Rhodovulum sp. DZ06 TaxID=3425126 RepID=UPI003D328CF6
MRPLLAAALAALLAPAAPAAAQACAPSEAACAVAGGAYHIRLPGGPGPHPAVLFLHGHGGNGARAIANESRLGAFLAAGYAVIGPDGDRWRGPGSPRGWNAMAAPGRRDDVAFLRAVARDAAARFGLDPARIAAAGFSAGGMMTWRLACDAPAAFTGFAPVAGVFWKPVPTTCAGPAPIFHTHGTTDRVVPIAGRAVGGGRLVQGDADEVLSAAAARMACAAPAPTARLGEIPGGWQAQEWPGCDGGALVSVRWGGGHDVPPGWAQAALAFLDSLAAPR